MLFPLYGGFYYILFRQQRSSPGKYPRKLNAFLRRLPAEVCGTSTLRRHPDAATEQRIPPFPAKYEIHFRHQRFPYASAPG
jgi:hypothetical protein